MSYEQKAAGHGLMIYLMWSESDKQILWLNIYIHGSFSTSKGRCFCVFYVLRCTRSSSSSQWLLYMRACMRLWPFLLKGKGNSLCAKKKSIYVTPGQDSEALNMPCLTFAWAEPAITATDKERRRAKERLVGSRYCRERSMSSKYIWEVLQRDPSALTW